MHPALHASACALALALLSGSGQAWASTTHSAFSDVAGSAATDGYNQLTNARITTSQLVAGLAGNAHGEGAASFKRLTGGYYPASNGLYSWSTDSAFSFTVGNAVAGLSSVNLQSFVTVDTSQGVDGMLEAGYLPTLSYNGGAQSLAPVYTMSSVAGGFDMDGNALSASASNPNYGQFAWDLSGVGTSVSSFTITFGLDTHANALAFQLDQVAAVPEPGTYAFAAIGLALCAGAGWRRRHKTRSLAA
ncbi:PEP-CTERM sorting domain-containing protein [Roseateles sp. LKC17W]|uniref:PEP-CTERM sorting domain-containing protein n=1 Tax=Pelomonas margarita TaxID=3299031 RepID=A0ABW7FPR2_9BURK